MANRRVLSLALMVTGWSVLAADASADANIARLPIAITQHYDDGDFSKFECPFGIRRKGDAPCRLTLREGSLRVSASFEPLTLGYQYISQEYRLFGTLKEGNVQLSLSVDCIEADLAGNQHERGRASCQLVYAMMGGELIVEAVHATSEMGGVVVRSSRRQ